MSGIYIQGMKMPTNEPLIIKINPDGSISTIWKNDYKKYEVIPVPPHGRLINAGYVYTGLEMRLAKFVEEGRTMHSQQYEFGYWRGIEDAKSALSNAPTIIPASEEDKR